MLFDVCEILCSIATKRNIYYVAAALSTGSLSETNEFLSFKDNMLFV